MNISSGILRLLVVLPLAALSATPTVQIVDIPSAAMKRTVTCSVMLPSSYAAGWSDYPVIYMLHGSGNDNTTYSASPEILRAVEKYGFVAVCPKDGNDWWLDAPSDASIRYETFVSSELVAFVDANYRTVRSRDRRMIAGHSMGGHGAGFIGMRHKDVFGTVGIVIGGVDLTQDTQRADLIRLLGPYDGNNDVWAAHSVVTEAAKLADGDLALFVTVGVDDMFIGPNRTLHDTLTKNGVTHVYEEITQAGLTTHTRATAYCGLVRAFEFAAEAWGTEVRADETASGNLEATGANTFYLRGNDGDNASSMTGAGSPVGWTNAVGAVESKPSAGHHYVIDGRHMPVGVVGSMRTPTDSSSVTFAGDSLTVNNGSQIALLNQASTTYGFPKLLVSEGDGRVCLMQKTAIVEGDWEVLSGGRLVLRRSGSTDTDVDFDIRASISGAGTLCMLTENNETLKGNGTDIFRGDNSAFVGSFVSDTTRTDVMLAFSGEKSWFGNPSVPDASGFNLSAAATEVSFLNSMRLDTPNRLIDMGSNRSFFRAAPSAEVVVAAPLKGSNGVHLGVIGDSPVSGARFVLAADNSALSGKFQVDPLVTVVISNRLAMAGAQAAFFGKTKETASTLELDLDAIGPDGALVGDFPYGVTGAFWKMSLTTREDLPEYASITLLRRPNASASEFVMPTEGCLLNGRLASCRLSVVQDGADAVLKAVFVGDFYFLMQDRTSLGSTAQWRRLSDGKIVSKDVSGCQLAVSSGLILNNDDAAGVFSGESLCLYDGAFFPRNSNGKEYVIDNLKFIGPFNNEIRVGADGGVVLGGANWQLATPTSVAVLSLGSAAAVRRDMTIAASIACATGGTVRCTDGPTAVQPNVLTLSGDNTGFRGRFVHDYYAAGAKTVIASVSAWPGDPVGACDARGFTVANNATVSFLTSVTSGRTRGVWLEKGATIDVAAGETVRLEGPLTAPDGFTKTGDGTLVVFAKNVDKNAVTVKSGKVVWLTRGLVIMLQ